MADRLDAPVGVQLSEVTEGGAMVVWVMRTVVVVGGRRWSGCKDEKVRWL